MFILYLVIAKEFNYTFSRNLINNSKIYFWYFDTETKSHKLCSIQEITVVWESDLLFETT